MGRGRGVLAGVVLRHIFFDLVAVARVSGIHNGSVAIGAHRITSRVKGRYVVWNCCCIVVSSHGTTESIFRVDTRGGCARLLLFHNWMASSASHHSCLPPLSSTLKTSDKASNHHTCHELARPQEHSRGQRLSWRFPQWGTGRSRWRER